MKLDVFLSLFDQKEKKSLGADFLSTHVKNKYIPIEKKKELAEAIVDQSINSGMDSILKYILTCITVFDIYTDIQRSAVNSTNQHERMLSDFNKINERRIFDILIGLIDERELKEFNMVLQMVTDDLMVNKYNN